MSTTTVRARVGPVEEAASPPEPKWNGLYRVGGLCLAGVGLIYLTNVTFGTILGVPPADSQRYLTSLTDHATLARVTYGLYSLAAFLLVPAALALYLALKHVARTSMLISAGLLAMFAVLDIAMTEFNSLTLVTLAQHSAAATSDAGRAAYAAAADYALATIPLATFYSWVVSSLALLIVGIVMLRAVFSKLTAYLGIVTGAAGIVGGFYVVLPGLSILLSPTLLAFGLWLVTAGLRLYRVGTRRHVDESRAIAATGRSVPSAASSDG